MDNGEWKMTDQAENLRRKMGVSYRKSQAKTIAVISGKGGVGKSNFALNFSLELINRDKKVVIVDLDVGMGNINILLGLQPKRTIVDLFNDQLSIFEILEKGPRNLSYIAGGTGLSQFITMGDQQKEFFFEQYRQLVEVYDYIIFDMGAGVTEESLYFILAADECITITTGEPTSITDAYSMIKQVVINGGEMPIHVILNRARSRNEWSGLKQFQQVVQQFLQIRVHPLGIIPEDKNVTEAVIRQIPYILLNKKAPSAKSLRQLTDNYLINSDEIQLTYQPAFLDRFKNLLRGKI